MFDSLVFKSSEERNQVDAMKQRIVRAIKKGNNEIDYIIEACASKVKGVNFRFTNPKIFGLALGELEYTKVIYYDQTLQGYKLA